MPLPLDMSNELSEARTLLEACHHLCKKTAVDEVVRNILPEIKAAHPSSSRRIPRVTGFFGPPSPYSELKSQGEDLVSWMSSGDSAYSRTPS